MIRGSEPKINCTIRQALGKVDRGVKSEVKEIERELNIIHM